MKIEEINIDGKSIGTIDASDKVFKVKPRRYHSIGYRLATE